MGGQEGDALQGTRFSSVAVAETLKLPTLVWSSFILGLLRLPSQRLALADSQICMLCVCIMLFEEEKKKRKKVAVAERSVTFDVIEICLPFLPSFLSSTTNVCPYIFD